MCGPFCACPCGTCWDLALFPHSSSTLLSASPEQLPRLVFSAEKQPLPTTVPGVCKTHENVLLGGAEFASWTRDPGRSVLIHEVLAADLQRELLHVAQDTPGLVGAGTSNPLAQSGSAFFLPARSMLGDFFVVLILVLRVCGTSGFGTGLSLCPCTQPTDGRHRHSHWGLPGAAPVRALGPPHSRRGSHLPPHILVSSLSGTRRC